jgi:hypothetical protein
MKKQLILLSFVSSILLADTFINPLPASFRSIDNGGTKQAIDAYKDGIGAELIDKQGIATDNSAMNTLVLKYGEAAKANNVTIVDQVVYGNSNPTSADLALAGRLTIDGAACNDGNIGTSGETWLSGICQGGISNESFKSTATNLTGRLTPVKLGSSLISGSIDYLFDQYWNSSQGVAAIFLFVGDYVKFSVDKPFRVWRTGSEFYTRNDNLTIHKINSDNSITDFSYQNQQIPNS